MSEQTVMSISDRLDEDAEFANMVRGLHSTYDLHIKVYPNRDKGGIDWVARLSGEDFLDGYWRAIRTGRAKNIKKAISAAVKPTKHDRWVRKFRDRGEWEDRHVDQ